MPEPERSLPHRSAGATGRRGAGQLAPGPGQANGRPEAAAPGRDARAWPPWMAPAALFAALVLAAIGGLVVDIPALALGVKVSSSHVPPGLVIADTAVQDVAFVVAALFFAQLGGRALSAWQFGLRPTRLRRAVWSALLAGVAFLVFLALWSAAERKLELDHLHELRDHIAELAHFPAFDGIFN